MRSLRREPGLLLALLGVALLVLAFIVYPQVQVVVTPGADGYVAFIQEGTWLIPLRNSLELTALSTTTAVVLGFVYAYAMVYSNMRWKPFFRLIGILPLLSPPFVVAAAYILLFGPRGLVSYGVFGLSPNILGLYGIWGVQTIAFFPFAYQLIADVLSRSDPRLEQAARNLGANAWQVFRGVTLPLARPGRAAAVSTILLVLALILYLAKVRLDGGRSFVTVTGRATSIPRPPVSRALSWACFVACLGLSGLILLVYGALLVSAFTRAFPTDLRLTTEHFEYLSAHSLSLQNTLMYGLAAATVSA